MSDPAVPDSERDREAARAINQRLFETSLDLILIVDRQGNFIRVSPSSAAILGYAPEELIGHGAAGFLYPEDLESTRQEMRLARRTGFMRNFACRYVRKDGRIVTLTWTGVWSEAEQQHFFIGRDMTDRLAAEERLHRAQRLEAVGQLTGGIAHDFNNILAVILGGLEQQRELLQQGTAPRSLDQVTRLGQIALDAAQRGAALVRRLLAFSRNQPLQPQLLDLRRSLRELEAMLLRTLGETIVVDMRIAGDLWPVMADPAQFENAVLNLAINARDAMPKGGRLAIACANSKVDDIVAAGEMQTGDYVTIAVSDTGPGIPADVLAHVFEPFFTTKEVGKGTGLGLSMVYGYARQSGGTVRIYSEVGHGTEVRIYLPRAPGLVAEPSPDAAPAGAAAPSSAGQRILVVEDRQDVREVTVYLLGSLGYRTLDAESASAALVILDRGEVFDLLLTDVIMPGKMNGIDLAREARRRFPSMPIVFTSGFSDPETIRAEATTLGVTTLSKPYGKAELAEHLRLAFQRCL